MEQNIYMHSIEVAYALKIIESKKSALLKQERESIYKTSDRQN
jgi:hypothetical protein